MNKKHNEPTDGYLTGVCLSFLLGVVLMYIIWSFAFPCQKCQTCMSVEECRKTQTEHYKFCGNFVLKIGDWNHD